MKSRKTRMFTALGLVAISGFSLVAVSFVEAQTKDIKLDPTNARQTIPTIQFRSDIKDGSKYVELTNVRDLLRINTKESNFVLKKGSSDASGRGATILGGNNNHVDNGNYSTIIAGSDNQVNNSSYATIGGGEKNIVQGGYGTVAGGQENTAKTYSTVVGGSKNKAAGDYAVALGNNSEANSDYSVAMGKNAKVSAPNSFLWSDNGATLSSSHSNVFAVVGDNGMVVNKDKAHRFAKLTIGGSIIINSRTSDASTCNSTTVGVVKVTGGSHGQACFCSCNGSKRNSLYGGGDCSSKCDTSITPVCENILIKDCSSSPYSYSGHCRIGEVAEGDGAYMVDKDGKIHWTCQTNDGKTASCASDVTSTIGTCTEPAPYGRCSGGYDGACYKFLDGSDAGFNGIVNATLYNNRTAALGNYCAWYCSDDCYKKGDLCVPMEGCDEYEEGERHVPYLAHGETRTITNNAGTCTRTATCDNGTPALGTPTCYSCQGSYPSGVTLSTVAPTSNKNWTCATDTAQACTYTCPTGQECNGTSGCKTKKNSMVDCGEGEYTCEGTGATMTYDDNMSSTEWKWKCTSEDGSTTKSCSKSCGEGETLQWSSLHNGSCTVVSSSPACGTATQSSSLEKPAANTLCSIGTATDPVEAIVGEPGSIGWSWECSEGGNSVGCWTYMPSAEIGCDRVSTPPAVASFFFTPTYEVAGAWVDIRAQVTCGNGATDTIYDTFKLDPTSSIGNLLINGVYCGGEGVASIQRVDIVGFSSNQNYNGYRLVAGKSCSDNDAPVCGTANGTTRSSAPATYNEKCSVGTPSAIYGGEDGNGWGWTCEQNGNTVPCTAWEYPACGDADGQTVANMPEGTAACNPGYLKAGGGLSSDGSQYEWTCVNGTGQVDCSATAVYNYNIYWSPNYTTERSIYYDLVVKSADTNNQENLPVDTALKSFVSYTANGMEYSNDGYILSLNGDSGNNGKYKIGHVVGSYSDLSFNEVQLTFDNGESTITIDDGGIYNLNLILSGGSSYECIGSQPGDYTIKSPATPISNKNWEYKEGYTQSQLGACQWSCKDSTYERNGTTMNCRKKSYSCQGTPPSGVTRSSEAPTSNINWFCATDTGQACSYTCPTGQECNGTSGCKTKKNSMVDCGEGEYTCEGTGATMTYDDNMSSTEWKWKCTSEDGSTTKSCSKSCGEGETLQWSSLHNGSCASESHYYISLGLRKHTTERATEIIIYVKDGSGTSTRIPDDKLNIAYHMRSSNGSDFSYWENAGNKSDGSVFDGVPDLLGYKLDEIEFYSDDNELVEEMDDSGLTAKIGNNTYHIIGFVGEAGQCGKATDQDSITKPTSQLCNKGLESDVKAILKNNKFYWSWTCYGTSDASCETGIPTAEFNRCNPTTSSMTVKYTLYNNDFDGSMNFDSNGVVIGDSRVEATLGSSNPQTINSTAITEINSVRYGTNLLPGREGAEVYIKNNYALKGGNYDSSLCSSCTPKTCATYGYSSSISDYCYSIVPTKFDDGCGGQLTCYKNGCAANGHIGYACVARSELPPTGPACNNAGGMKDVQSVENDGYACIMCNGVSCQGELKFNIANHGLMDVVVLSYTWWDASGTEHTSPFIDCEGQEDMIIRSDHGDAICSIGKIPCGSYNGGYINYQHYPYSTDPHMISTNAINLGESGLTYYMITIDD